VTGTRAVVPIALLVSVSLSLLLASSGLPPAHAQVTEAPKAELFPDPTKFAYGLYTQGDLGAVTVLGAAGAHLRPGWGLGLTVGYDLTKWLAIEARGLGSTHVTEFANAPQDGELMQLYHLSGALKLSLRYRYFALSADGGAGIVRTSTNILTTVPGLGDRQMSLAYGGGLSLEYHTLSRHFAFGIHGGYFLLPGIGQSHSLLTTALMRYTC
jgi:hypothetical protein